MKIDYNMERNRVTALQLIEDTKDQIALLRRQLIELNEIAYSTIDDLSKHDVYYDDENVYMELVQANNVANNVQDLKDNSRVQKRLIEQQLPEWEY